MKQRRESRKFSASFRFYSTSVPPAIVTRMLGIEPTDSWLVGERSLRGPKRRENMWSYEVAPQGGASLSEYLKALCRTFWNKRARIKALAPKGHFFFWCACFSRTPETTVNVSREVLKEIQKFEATLSISVYSVD